MEIFLVLGEMYLYGFYSAVDKRISRQSHKLEIVGSNPTLASKNFRVPLPYSAAPSQRLLTRRTNLIHSLRPEPLVFSGHLSLAVMGFLHFLMAGQGSFCLVSIPLE